MTDWRASFEEEEGPSIDRWIRGGDKIGRGDEEVGSRSGKHNAIRHVGVAENCMCLFRWPEAPIRTTQSAEG